MYTFGDTGGKIRYYDIYLRGTTTYTRPTDAAGVTALLATGTKIGQVEAKNAKLTIEPAEVSVLGDGSEHAGAQQAALEIKHMNNTVANIQHLEDNFDNELCDVIFNDANNSVIKVWKNIRLMVKTETNSGEKELVMLSGKRLVGDKSDIEDLFEEPAS